MAGSPHTAPHGFWQGLFDIRALFEKPATPMYPAADAGRIHWLEARPGQGGRVVLMQRDRDDVERCLTPEHFSLRSRVHEYGGCPYVLSDGVCWFVNDADQRVYRQPLDGDTQPVAVTPASDGGGQLRYIDLRVTPDHRHLVCVMERDRADAENDNLLAAIRLETGAIHPPRVLHQGHDFYANPALDPDRGRIAWVHWDHPCMPWDESEAVVAAYRENAAGRLQLGDAVRVMGAPDTSVCQLAFDDDGDLLLAIDGHAAPGAPADFWNLYRWRAGGFTQLTFDAREYGASHWVFGDNRYVVLDDCLLAVRTGPDGDELMRVDKHGGGAERLDGDAVSIKQLCRAGPHQALLITAARDRSPALTYWKHGRLTPVKGVPELLPREAVSAPRAIEFPTTEGATAHGFFYPPVNPRYRAPAGQAPPLLVMAHGGPTARCANALDLTRQYWTGIGFAVLDVNYRGSTGYGRAYRQSLLGQWGCRDTADIVHGIEHAARRGWIDARRVFIRGRSAGGYAVLSVLTQFPHVFAAGACYYGIGNLATLAQITHKFEGRYTDRLIGEAYDPQRAGQPDSRFYERSPIHAVAAIQCPLIVLQGLEDRIVPPEVAREIAAALRRQGLDYEYVEYPGEGHGFRSSEANIDALERETAFYRKVLGGESTPPQDPSGEPSAS